MAKILVADDNSNVQKTVALALAELGVEVVAVNNGDAAVKKLADVSPDLVLADIFMPVRNGYEVCEYVKKDSRFSHVPVVLLVGAFDPLDEREAQRVGADGILKKPFVPPDPLITMVKTLLDRTLGDRLVAVAVSKPGVSMQRKAGGVAATEEHPSATETMEEMPVEEFLPPVERLSFGEGDRPIAFGQLLETPAKQSGETETGLVGSVDDEQILTSSRDASLGDPIFWRTEEPAPETEEVNSEAEGDISSGIPMRPWKPDEESISHHAETEILQPIEPFELVRETKDEEADQTSTIVETSVSLVQDPASQALLTVENTKLEDLAANPIEWMASIPPPPAEETPEAAPDWSAADIEATDNISANEADNLKSVLEPVAPEIPAPVETPVSVSASTPAQPSMPPPAAPLEQPQAKIAVQNPDPAKTQPSLKPLAQSAEDTARSIPRQEWADLTASLQSKPIEPAAEKPKPSAAPVAQSHSMPTAIAQPTSDSVAQIPAASGVNFQSASAPSAPPSAPDPALVEAVVQRILDKMRPQVVDIITKEFLRPVVQALVTREIQKK